jgi:hypothetical protein
MTFNGITRHRQRRRLERRRYCEWIRREGLLDVVCGQGDLREVVGIRTRAPLLLFSTGVETVVPNAPVGKIDIREPVDDGLLQIVVKQPTAARVSEPGTTQTTA